MSISARLIAFVQEEVFEPVDEGMRTRLAERFPDQETELTVNGPKTIFRVDNIEVIVTNPTCSEK